MSETLFINRCFASCWRLLQRRSPTMMSPLDYEDLSDDDANDNEFAYLQDDDEVVRSGRDNMPVHYLLLLQS